MCPRQISFGTIKIILSWHCYQTPTFYLTKTIKTSVMETYLTPSLWKGMRLHVSCGSTCERSASGGTGALDSLFSNWEEKDCSTAGGKGSISTIGSSLSSTTRHKTSWSTTYYVLDFLVRIAGKKSHILLWCSEIQ